MDFLARLEQCFGELMQPKPKELAEALDRLNAQFDDVLPYLQDPAHLPYGRKLLYHTDDVEVLVMNWSPVLDCAPHDHGSSSGWVKVVNGHSSHTLYRIDDDGVPIEHVKRVEPQGTLFFAPVGMVHKMGNDHEEQLVTLHVYSPPVSGMKVYDLEKCALCIVSENCGAWWPEEQRQIVQELKLRNRERIALEEERA